MVTPVGVRAGAPSRVAVVVEFIVVRVWAGGGPSRRVVAVALVVCEGIAGGCSCQHCHRRLAIRVQLQGRLVLRQSLGVVLHEAHLRVRRDVLRRELVAAQRAPDHHLVHARVHVGTEAAAAASVRRGAGIRIRHGRWRVRTPVSTASGAAWWGCRLQGDGRARLDHGGAAVVVAVVVAVTVAVAAVVSTTLQRCQRHCRGRDGGGATTPRSLP